MVCTNVVPTIDYSTCVGRCNPTSNDDYVPGRPCYCDQSCDQFENCCQDYYVLCMRQLSYFFASFIDILLLYDRCILRIMMLTLSVRRQEYLMKVILSGLRCSAVGQTVIRQETVS